MDAEPHAFWPKPGSEWQHWSDLLVATQLAACRAGFTSIGRQWHPIQPDTLLICCSVERTTQREQRCRRTLIRAQAMDPLKPDKGRWRVADRSTSNLSLLPHVFHKGGVGVSEKLENPVLSPTALAPGDKLVGYRAMHTLEGVLRAAARQEGRFLTAAHESSGARIYTFSCSLGSQLCRFLIRLKEDPLFSETDPRWECIEIRGLHSCKTEAEPPQKRLRKHLEFFGGGVSLTSGYTGRRLQRSYHGTRKEEPPSSSAHAKRDVVPVTPLRGASPELLDPSVNSPDVDSGEEKPNFRRSPGLEPLSPPRFKHAKLAALPPQPPPAIARSPSPPPASSTPCEAALSALSVAISEAASANKTLEAASKSFEAAKSAAEEKARVVEERRRQLQRALDLMQQQSIKALESPIPKERPLSKAQKKKLKHQQAVLEEKKEEKAKKRHHWKRNRKKKDKGAGKGQAKQKVQGGK
ncbi:hypothetical protein JCM6882_004397 [Rhodosporidiobolus microsporus]